MTAATSPYDLRAFRHLAACGVAALALVTLGACDKKSDGAGGSASAAGSAATSPPGTPAAGKKPKATLKLADMKAAYKTAFDGPSVMRDPMDKKIAAFVAKVGAPFSDDGRKKDWYALDGDNCSKVEIDGKDGSIMDMTTDKSDCGM